MKSTKTSPLLESTRKSRPKYLFVVPSSSQMYSGTGAVVFDWIRFAKTEFEFSILMDSCVNQNYEITKDFCKQEDIEFLSSKGTNSPGAPDIKILEISSLLGSRKFDYIECVSWANAASNLDVLSFLNSDTKLIYTPHWQPIETIGSTFEFHQIEPVLKKMLQRSDFVFADSNHEATILRGISQRTDNVHTVYLGVNNQVKSIKQIHTDKGFFLSVGDFRETRKRFDLTLKIFDEYRKNGGNWDLFLVGNHSNLFKIPRKLKNRVKTFGYISTDELNSLYTSAKAYLSTSEYEAFSVPIAESLSVGTQVVINRLPVLESIFGDLPGVNFIDNNKVVESAQKLSALEEVEKEIVSNAASLRFSKEKTYGTKLNILNLGTK